MISKEMHQSALCTYDVTGCLDRLRMVMIYSIAFLFLFCFLFFFLQAEDGIRDVAVTGVQFFFSSRRRHTRCSRDWSSDVCSSDLLTQSDVGESWQRGVVVGRLQRQRAQARRRRCQPCGAGVVAAQPCPPHQIGRASCRERVEISVGGGSLKKKRDSNAAHEAVR